MFQKIQAASLMLLLVFAASGCSGDAAADRNLGKIQAIGDKEGGSEEEIQFLLDRLQNGNAGERTSAAWALGRSGGLDAVPLLADAVQNDSDLYVRVNAIKALVRFQGEEARAVFLDQLDADEEEIQAEALKALGTEKYASEHEAVAHLCQSESAGIRGIAVDTLGRMADPQVLTYLEPMTSDADKDVRNIVAFTMGKLGDESSVPHLLGMLEDGEWEVRANAAQALGMIGDPSARAALEDILEDPSDSVRFAAQRALKKLG